MKSQSVLISYNKRALGGLTIKSQKFSKTPLVWTSFRSFSPSGFDARPKAFNLGGCLDQEKPKILTKYNSFTSKFLVKGLCLKSYRSFLGKKLTHMLGRPKVLDKNLAPSGVGLLGLTRGVSGNKKGHQIRHQERSNEQGHQSHYQTFGQWPFLVKKAALSPPCQQQQEEAMFRKPMVGSFKAQVLLGPFLPVRSKGRKGTMGLRLGLACPLLPFFEASTLWVHGAPSWCLLHHLAVLRKKGQGSKGVKSSPTQVRPRRVLSWCQLFAKHLAPLEPRPSWPKPLRPLAGPSLALLSTIPMKTQELGDSVTKVLLANKSTTKAQNLFRSPSTSSKSEVFGLTSKSSSRLLSSNFLWSKTDQQAKDSGTFLVPCRFLNTKAYSRSLSFRHRLRPCFALEPTREFSNIALSRNPLSSLAQHNTQYPQNVLASLNKYKEVQIIKTVLIPPVLTNRFVFGLYKLQKQTYKYKEPIRNICKYLVVYVVGSVCWLNYANISTKIEKTGTKQGWNLAQEMVLKNLPLLKNSDLFLTKETYQVPTLSPWWLGPCAAQGHQDSLALVVPYLRRGCACASQGARQAPRSTSFDPRPQPCQSHQEGQEQVPSVIPLSKALERGNEQEGGGALLAQEVMTSGQSLRKATLSPSNTGTNKCSLVPETFPGAQKLNILSTVPSGSKGFAYKALDQGLQNNYTFFRETSNPSSFLVNSSSVNTVLGLCYSADGFGQRPQLGPRPFQHFSQDKITQNYIANSPLKGSLRLNMKGNWIGKKEITQTKNLVFFARKPLFFKKERSSFLSTQMLSQKEQYLCSGTAMIMGSEFDFLPRKIESTGFSNQNKGKKNSVDNRHVKFSVEMTKMDKPKIYKFISDVTLQSIKSADYGQGLPPSGGAPSAQDAFGMTPLSFLAQGARLRRETGAKLNRPNVDKGINHPNRSPNRTIIEQKHFSRTLIMVRFDSKEGAYLPTNRAGTNKTLNRTTIVKKKKNLKEKALLGRFCRSRLQSGFNFPDIFLLNKPLIEVEKNGAALKIKRNFGVNPEKSSIPTFLRPFIKTDRTLFSVRPEFDGSNEKTKRQFNYSKIDSSKSARAMTWSKSSLKLKTKGLKNLTNSPESFFGTSYLHLGERFTIEKIKSKNQIGFLYSVHNGDMFAPSLKSRVPFVSTGTSLNTVFGKKALKQQSSKKAFKTQSPFTNARAVSQWHIIEFPKSKGYWFHRDHVQQNYETRGPNQSHTDSKNGFNIPYPIKNQKITNSGLVETQQEKANNLSFLLYPKRISGKVNRHLINPFKYYNPGTKRDRNIEDAMLTLEGYKKSRLFPTTHINYQGISSILDASVPKKHQGQYLNTQTNQDIDLQSILSGMRQKNEAQRIAEKTIGSLYGNSGYKKESNLSVQDSFGEADNSSLAWENIEETRGADSFFEESTLFLKHHENPIQKKNLRNTNNYPSRTLLAVTSQTQCPKNLKATTLSEYNFTNLGISRYSLNPNYSTVKFLEERLVENSQLKTIPLDSSGPSAKFWPGKKAEKNQDQREGKGSLQGSNQTKGFYFEKIFATPALRSQPQTFRSTITVENALSSSVTGRPLAPTGDPGFGFDSPKALLPPLPPIAKHSKGVATLSPPPSVTSGQSLWEATLVAQRAKPSKTGFECYASRPQPPAGIGTKKTHFYSFIQNLRYKNTSIFSFKNAFTRVQVWGSLSKILFFSVIWSSYKILATPLTISNFLPATFTEAIGLQSFQKKYRIITRGNTKVDFKNLAGIEKTLSELRDLIWTFRLVGTGGPYGEYSNLTSLPYFGNSFGQERSSVFSKTRNRLLLVGPPGTGKTLLVKALAAEANVPVIVQPVSQLRMIGGVENPVSALFHVARQIKPCIIFLDELDTLGTDIGHSDKSSNTEQKIDTKLAQKYTYTLLLELDGLISSTRDLLIIGATNRPETLNPALTRAGRFETVINCNLPSQEQRLALFSLYLPRGSEFTGLSCALRSTGAPPVLCEGRKGGRLGCASQEVATKPKSYGLGPFGTSGALLSTGPLNSNSSSSLVLKPSQAPQLRFKDQKLIKNVSYLQYVTKTSYGLSQASIETAINQSALNSILQGHRSHTFTTLEQAFSAVRVLTSKTTTGRAFDSSWSFSRLGPKGASKALVQRRGGLTPKARGPSALALLAVPSKGVRLREATLSPSKTGHNPLVNMFTSNQKNSIQSLSSGVLDIGVNKSKVILKKNIKLTSTEFDPKTDSGFKVELSAKKEKKVNQKNLQFLVCTAYQTTGPFLLSQKITSYSKKFFKVSLTGLLKRRQFTVYKKNKEGSALQSLEFGLFQNYAGQACLNLYSGIRCPSLQFSHTFGLYKNPVQLGTTLFLLKNSEDGHFSTKSGILPIPWSQRDAEVPVGLNELLSTNKKQKNQYWCQNIKKENKSRNTQQISSVQKTSSFFVNELSRQTRLSNPLMTGWFRMYLSRPIFRYDSSEYIENKEYYPKNNYSFYSEKRLEPRKGLVPVLSKASRGQRVTHFINVATLSHQTTFNVPLTWTGATPKPRVNDNTVPQVHEIFGKIYRENHFVPQKFSLYLAIVAFIFHNTLLFMQENRELADYCVYKKLRYGDLYEFYIDQVCQKFR